MRFRKSKFTRFSKRDIPCLRYGVIHSRFGFSDGVSIVMHQIEGVMISDLKIPKNNIFYLVGKSAHKTAKITEKEVLLDGNKVNSLVVKNFGSGFGGSISEEIESAICKAEKIIDNFVKKNKIDVIIAHNTSHPVNFVLSVALSRYYRNSLQMNKATPKYLLWWHDSHIERKHFTKPSLDVKRYLLEGVPGSFVEFIFY